MCLRRLVWRKRVGVEPTIRPAKGRIAGFEGREDHRTPCAPAEVRRNRSISLRAIEGAAGKTRQGRRASYSEFDIGKCED